MTSATVIPGRQMLSEIKNKFDALNVLVNNAGVAPSVRADILDATEESYERVMKINLQGPYFLTQSVANMMIEQKKNKSKNPMLYCKYFFDFIHHCFSRTRRILRLKSWNEYDD